MVEGAGKGGLAAVCAAAAQAAQASLHRQILAHLVAQAWPEHAHASDGKEMVQR